ncbi:MAG: ABC transporter ATP-binding protein [Candidatus Omnitrophica bacterium]|nr:ABC transporter ATP-binding protein [Candidatus Omnitrophota bacterium]
MSFDEPIITFDNVWKKYSKSGIFHRSLREDVMRIFSLKQDNLKLAGNEFWALKNISFQIFKGQTLGLYGPNGAGKSTILKLMSDITYPNKGSISVQESVAPLIAMGAGFHFDLSGRENIYVNGAILKMKIKEINKKMESIIKFSGIEEFIDMPVKNYSSGMHLRLAFSIAIHSEASIYLFDEIIGSGGDEEFRKKCFDKIFELKEKKKTIVLVSHDMEVLKNFSNRILFLNKGEITSEEVL